MEPEEKFIDVLQNLEFMIVTSFRQHPDMTDYQVIRALEALIAEYRAESRGQTARPVKLEGYEQEVFESVKNMSEMRLGREETEIKLSPQTLDDMLYCLRKIHKSAQNWNKRHGRQGYLHFIEQFVR
jgi:hypothetical protein